MRNTSRPSFLLETMAIMRRPPVWDRATRAAPTRRETVMLTWWGRCWRSSREVVLSCRELRSPTRSLEDKALASEGICGVRACAVCACVMCVRVCWNQFYATARESRSVSDSNASSTILVIAFSTTLRPRNQSYVLAPWYDNGSCSITRLLSWPKGLEKSFQVWFHRNHKSAVWEPDHVAPWRVSPTTPTTPMRT